jgi:hypothetical protein
MLKAKYSGIPTYFDPMTNKLVGRNWFYNILLEIILWLDVNIFKVDTFKIDIEDKR